MTQRKDKDTAAIADAMIGAAQALERGARNLKDCAKHIRMEGLTEWGGGNVIENQREHKAHDIKSAATAAIVALGVKCDYLIEGSYTS